MSREAWFRVAFKKCHGGIAVNPHTSVTLKQLRDVWSNYVPKKERSGK